MTPRINTSQLQDLAFLRPKQKAISLHIPFLWIIRCRVDAARPITGKLIGLRFVLLYTNEYTSRHTYCLILFIAQTLNQKRRIKNGCYDRANPQTHKHTYLHKLGFITIKDKHQQTGKLKQNIIEHASNGALIDIWSDYLIYRVFLFLLLFFHAPLLLRKRSFIRFCKIDYI